MLQLNLSYALSYVQMGLIIARILISHGSPGVGRVQSPVLTTSRAAITSYAGALGTYSRGCTFFFFSLVNNGASGYY